LVKHSSWFAGRQSPSEREREGGRERGREGRRGRRRGVERDRGWEREREREQTRSGIFSSKDSNPIMGSHCQDLM
jgi:hypothetical protein